MTNFVQTRLVLALGLLWMMASPSHAGIMTYTITALDFSGSLGANTFTDATVTFSGTGDTANIMHPTANVYELLLTTASVTVSGVGTATFTDTIQIQDFKPQGQILLEDIGEGHMIGIVSAGLEGYELNTAIGPVSGTVMPGDLIPHYPTTAGDFGFSGPINGDGSVQTSAVPEPSTLIMASIASSLLGIGAVWRRRSRSA